jgi:hypothetical protein
MNLVSHVIIPKLELGSNPAPSMDYVRIFMLWFPMCVQALWCADPPVQGVLPKYLKGFMISEDNSDSEQARGRNPWNVPHY